MKKATLILVYIFLFSKFVTAEDGQSPTAKIRMYSFYTPSHQVLKDNWFLPTIQDDYEVIIKLGEQRCPSAKFRQDGWVETTLDKVDVIIEAIEQNWGNIFIFADIDIQFFKPTEQLILEAMSGKDMVVQRDNPSGVICSGFFACRANEKTLQLWKAVKQFMIDNHRDDQNSLNKFMRHKNPFDIKWDYLPSEFFGGGTLTETSWRPGRTLPIPNNIVLHHANWTVGIPNKIAQLNYVRSEVESKK